MKDFNSRIAELSETKQAILEQKLKQKTVNINYQQSIKKREKQDSLPLSSAQTWIWMSQQLKSGNPAYNRPSNIKLKGVIDVEVLEKSLNEIVRRHEVLRTSFRAKNERPIQEIAPSLTLTLSIVDLSDLSSAEKKNKIQRLATEEVQRPFDLSCIPLVRATLLRLEEEEHILLLTLHHIIFDGWSMRVLLRELATVYEAFCSGKPSPLPELPIQYADFARWQQKRLREEVIQSHLDYWKTQLSGDLPILELPTDRSRAAVQTNNGAKHSLVLSENLSESLKTLSRDEGVTLFMTLLTAFKILLHRYTGNEDIIVGSPIARRDRLETENLIGCFINTLVLRTQLDGNPSFKELLFRVREVVLGAMAHQELPIEKLVEKLQPERDLSHTPLFQVLFQLKNFPQEAWETTGLTFEEFEFDRGIALLDLSLSIVDKSPGLSCVFEYDKDLFDAATIERMAGHFQTLLEGIIANPLEPISQLPLLTTKEKIVQLFDLNSTPAESPPNLCIHQLFEAQVERTPDAVAAIFEEQQLTYQELNARANRLARYLQVLGVKPEVLVGILVERSLEMIVGILAILKAGGAYVPLDLAYPQQRLDFMLADARISVLLTQKKLVSLLPEYRGDRVCLDTYPENISAASDSNLVTTATHKNLAYVIYTSGSTGTPKGVEIEHQSLVNFTTAAIAEYGINSRDRVLQFASISFDAAAEEIYPCLTTGGTLVLRTDEMISSVSKFLKLCRDWQITVWDLPTAYWQQMISELETAALTLPESLRLVIIGGEKVVPEFVKKWQNCVGDFPQLVNSYGPTEGTVVSTTYKITLSASINHEVPIGVAIAGVQTYILDRNLQPVPIGIPGELYIGGAGLARGYLNQPELTQEKFISNTLINSEQGIRSGKKLYKTGDLARYLSDGNIEFLGRIDNQVKIRGFRIELGEIESILLQHPNIKEAVVIAREDKPTQLHLVAYIVPQIEPPTIKTLRYFLSSKLPDYMIPKALVLLTTLPLSPNGKLDRGALPAPDRSRSEEADTFVAPRIELERRLAEIWSEVLGHQSIGIRDNFFDIGGHSLLAIQAVAKIEKICGHNLSLMDFFRAQTIEQLAKILLLPLLQQEKRSLPWNPLKPIASNSSTSSSSKSPIFILNGGFLVFLAGAVWIARHLGAEQPCYSLHLRGIDGKQAPHERVEDMAAEAIAEIRKIQPEGPFFLVGLCFGGVVAFEMAQQLLEQGQNVALLALIESPAPKKLKKVKVGFGKANGTPQKKMIVPSEIFDDRTRSDPNLLRVAKGIYRALRIYEARAYPGKVTLFQAKEGDAQELSKRKKTLRIWQKLAGDLELHSLPGDHMTIYKESNIGELVDRLKDCLTKSISD